ncbi:uncharacterized protein K452DRAFT_317041 [Aplosporella prunicola CBS 121167]|uniref:Myb-like domain-containing protein n=1 Tax=Aplosporella prunicola CBS 121167 TaxID=1176127 RepID=A0A6A6BHT4_9PEZI|nr:uncharacterized protein K452DRAFT_317041 [Aplosporella prunicola CBS 121167]KAF2143556.1 hypothetical protein K452DRAFT_317041 [Aplosporella prunicola CBS 121167]
MPSNTNKPKTFYPGGGLHHSVAATFGFGHREQIDLERRTIVRRSATRSKRTHPPASNAAGTSAPAPPTPPPEAPAAPAEPTEPAANPPEPQPAPPAAEEPVTAATAGAPAPTPAAVAFSPDEEETIRHLRNAGISYRTIAHELNRTEEEVRARHMALSGERPKGGLPLRMGPILPLNVSQGAQPPAAPEAPHDAQAPQQPPPSRRAVQPGHPARHQQRRPRDERTIVLQPDHLFDEEELVLLARIVHDDAADHWQRIASRFFDRTGRRVHPRDIEKKMSGDVDAQEPSRGRQFLVLDATGLRRLLTDHQDDDVLESVGDERAGENQRRSSRVDGGEGGFGMGDLSRRVGEISDRIWAERNAYHNYGREEDCDSDVWTCSRTVSQSSDESSSWSSRYAMTDFSEDSETTSSQSTDDTLRPAQLYPIYHRRSRLPLRTGDSESTVTQNTYKTTRLEQNHPIYHHRRSRLPLRTRRYTTSNTTYSTDYTDYTGSTSYTDDSDSDTDNYSSTTDTTYQTATDRASSPTSSDTTFRTALAPPPSPTPSDTTFQTAPTHTSTNNETTGTKSHRHRRTYTSSTTSTSTTTAEADTEPHRRRKYRKRHSTSTTNNYYNTTNNYNNYYNTSAPAPAPTAERRPNTNDSSAHDSAHDSDRERKSKHRRRRSSCEKRRHR